jgi:nucleoid-associated protein YgaU
MRVLKIATAALLVSATAFAQDELARKQAVEYAARVPLENAVKGAPYSADTLVEGLQALADGNRIVRKTTGRVYRDTEGRTRREEDGPDGRVSISIVDPVAGYAYSLDPDSKVAWRTPAGTTAAIMEKLKAERAQVEQKYAEAVQQRKVGSEDAPSAVARAAEKEKAAAAAGEMRRREGGGAPASGEVMVRTRGGMTAMAYVPEPGPLEHKMLEGVAVEGRKTTTTIPAGKVGNEQPLTIASEEWRSPELNVLVMTHHSDPRTGESSYRLTNIVRAEPDRSFFMVPPDYTVKDTGVRKMLEASRK